MVNGQTPQKCGQKTRPILIFKFAQIALHTWQLYQLNTDALSVAVQFLHKTCPLLFPFFMNFFYLPSLKFRFYSSEQFHNSKFPIFFIAEHNHQHEQRQTGHTDVVCALSIVKHGTVDLFSAGI